jgi:carbon storage regulator
MTRTAKKSPRTFATSRKREFSMLILTRRAGEEIVIGNGDAEIGVVVLGVKGNQVRIGVAAPAHVPVHRREVAERIAAQQDDNRGNR